MWSNEAEAREEIKALAFDFSDMVLYDRTEKNSL